MTKFNISGSSLVCSAHFVYGTGIAVDSSGHAYAIGTASMPSFAVINAFKPSFVGVQDAVVAKFNSSGSGLVYSSYFGGNLTENSHGLALDEGGSIYIAGDSDSTDLPFTFGPFVPPGGGVLGFLAKISPTDAPGLGFSAQTLSFSTAVGTLTSQTLTLRSVGSQNLLLRRIWHCRGPCSPRRIPAPAPCLRVRAAQSQLRSHQSELARSEASC